ncbi:N-formylglutamate deformylase [Sphaerotilus sp.]|uniref:N-formylglutamate deformylase n=1 Tax=Sphaerotilus sp. TaxID=2093942 RepID=UPI002ACD393C|nr:N-formylglutamate deformylase [Sphaerotilus sp.]MDZ7855176.1 N-formylglutamate deformylase [Sphaerotilus sp.]
MPTDTFTLLPGRTPLLVSLPHAGTFIPETLRSAYTERALAVEDTDWHLDALYDFARELGAGLLMPRCSRYVIDLNRPPENTPMYPGANNTELCPTRSFTGELIYRDGCAPDAAEIDRRRAVYWQPYHDALAAELARLRALHGHAVLFDGHSIRAELPWLFEGRLPDLNLGTASGTSCAPSLRAALSGVLASQSAFTQVVDGRFKGGYITRHYGQPAAQIHAVQLEMGWHCYMDDTPGAPPAIDPTRAARVQPVLHALLQTLRDWTPGAAE